MAQSAATLEVTVVDQSDAVLSKATITLTSAEAMLERRVVAGESGNATFALLPPGRYVVRAEHTGFAPAEVPDVTLKVDDKIALRLQLKVEAVGETVVVTAQKREESIQNVPVPVTVMKADELVNKNLLKIQDYAAAVPGLNVGLTPAAFQFVSIRGITTASATTNPKVGILIDDVPIGASTARGGGLFVPDIDPGDLVRLEVLRGPQGTLYGASSLGGLIKYVTTDPSTDRLHGRIQIGSNGVTNGAEPGYGLRGSLNVPLSDTWAVLASGFTRREAGYIDNVTTGERGFNELHVSGGSLAALWRPSESFSIKLNALYQSYEGDGPSEVAASGLGDLKVDYLRGAGGYRKELQLYGATLKARIGGVDLTSVTGYSLFEPRSEQDLSTVPLWTSLAQNVFGLSGAKQYDGRYFKKYTQEARVSAPIGRRFEWLVGGFYTRETSDQYQGLQAVDPGTGSVAGDTFTISLPSKFQEYAAFGDLTYHITDRVDLQVGMRESHVTFWVQQIFAGPYVPAILGQPSPLIYPAVDMGENAFTYLLTPQFTVSPDLMVYARVASGYGAGGLNVVPGVPKEFGSEKTQNYEVGVKGGFFDQRVSVDASLYRIDYTDLQVSISNPQTGLTHTGNGSGAESRGVELSMSVRPLTGLVVSGWAAYNDAVLTEAFPAGPTIGIPGDRLPNSSRWSGYLSVDREFPLTQRLIGSVGGAVSFVGDRVGTFISSSQRDLYPSYTKGDLHARVTYDSWSVNLFADNVTDERGVLYGALRGSASILWRIQPRTVGVSISRSF